MDFVHPQIELNFKCVPCDLIFGKPESLKEHLEVSHFRLAKEKGLLPSESNAIQSLQIPVPVNPGFQEEPPNQKSDNVDIADPMPAENAKNACKLCDKKFKDSRKLRIHVVENHSNVREVVCDICDARFSCREYLQQHVTRIHKERQKIQCQLCDKTLAHQFSFNKHMRHVHAGERELPPCNHCGKTFSSAHNMKRHMKNCHFSSTNATNSMDKTSPFRVTTVTQQRDTKNSGDEVEIKQDSNALSRESEEKKTSIALVTPQDQEEKHKKENLKPHKCKLCDRTYALKDSLRRHLKLNHSVVKKDDIANDTNETGIKQDDPAPLPTKWLNRVAVSRKEFILAENARVAAIAMQMKKKEDTELKDEPMDKSNTKNNVTNVTPARLSIYKCEERCKQTEMVCGENFPNRAKLSVHKQKVHFNKPVFKCYFCDREFTQRTNLKTHQKNIHDRRKDFQCHYCSKTFSQKINMACHILRKHTK